MKRRVTGQLSAICCSGQPAFAGVIEQLTAQLLPSPWKRNCAPCPTWRNSYAKIEGKPLVMAHGTVGLRHAAMAVYNAYCDRVPVLIIGGNIVITPSPKRRRLLAARMR